MRMLNSFAKNVSDVPISIHWSIGLAIFKYCFSEDLGFPSRLSSATDQACGRHSVGICRTLIIMSTIHVK